MRFDEVDREYWAEADAVRFVIVNAGPEALERDELARREELLHALGYLQQ